MNGLGERIQKARTRSGLSQESLAELIGVSRNSVTSWENNQKEPTLTNLIRICQFTGVSSDFLLMNASCLNDTLPLSPKAMVLLECFIKEICQ